jgi:hypothetical protein
MKDESLRKSLQAIARRGIPENINLWPHLADILEKTDAVPMRPKWKLAWTIIIVILGLSIVTGVAYAVGRITGYLPGIGFVQTSSLRVLAGPVSQTRDGITVTIEQVVVDSERTVVVYKTEGLTIAAANSRGEGGPFGSTQLLRLPDSTLMEEDPDIGYTGTPEPVINDVRTQDGWPNYVWRLVYPPIPTLVDEGILLIPILQTMPAGAAPENWAMTFHLKPAPADMTLAPMIGVTQPDGIAEVTQAAGTVGPTLSTTSTHNGFTLLLDNVIELDDGFVFTGNLSWANGAFPTGKGVRLQDVPLILTDSSGQNIPIEPVQLVNGSYTNENQTAWSYRTNRKAFSGPLVLSIASITPTMIAPDVNFELDLGPNPQIGQIWEINRNFVLAGHTLRLLSVQLIGDSNPCWKSDLNYNFSSDQAGVSAYVSDVIPQSALEGTCSGGGGGGGGPVDPKLFTTATSYSSLPTGLHRFTITTYIPYTVSGPWQVTWNPPAVAAPTPTSEPGACLTLEKWNQLISRNDSLPSEVSGKIVTTVNEGGLLPAIYVSDLDGSGSRKIATGAWPSLSSDGTRLVYSAADGLRVLDLSTGKSTSLGADGYRLIWSPDDTRMLYSTSFDLYVIDADGSRQQKIETGSAGILSSVGWLPDNQTIVYGAMGGNGFTFTTHNLQSGERKELFSFQNKAGYGAISPDGQWIVFDDKVFGADNWGIYIARLDGSQRRLVASSDVPTAFNSVWSGAGRGAGDQWLILNTQNTDGTQIPVLINPFTCQATRLQNVNGIVEGWSP